MEIHIGKELKIIGNVLDSRVNRDLKESDITSAQFQLLMYLGSHKGDEIYQKDLEDAFLLSNPTVSGLLNLMEEREIILRTVSPEDKRKRLIVPTPKGNEMISKLRSHIQKVEQELVFGFSEKEVEQLQDFLHRIMCNIKKQ